MARASIVWLVVLSVLMGGVLGFGVARSLETAPVPPRAPNVFGAQGPLGVPGGATLPPLPPGVTVDQNGVIQGLNMAVEPGTQMLTWETLRGFEYSQAIGLSDIPESLKAVDGQRVTMIGFLMPLYEFDDIHQFALVGSHWSCCFGVPAGLNGVVNVALAAGHAGLDNSMEPLRVVGIFRAKEVKEEGWLVSIYSLEEAKAEPLK